MSTESPCPPPVARQLAEWALTMDLRDVDATVLERVKLHILDQIGAQVSCCSLPAPRISQQYVSQFGRSGGASILGTRLQADAEGAAFANGTAGSSFEIDDYGGNGAYAHPGCVVVPGAFAIAEELNVTGAALLCAATVGFETVIRLALATMPSMLAERGFHQTGAHGVFAVALEAAMLEQLDLATTINALGIAGSHASGTTEYAQSGGEVKRVHAGIGAAGGIRSARLARLGLSGPATIFEGKRGFLQAFCNAYDASFIHNDLGTRWHFPERGAIKPYASCALIHHHFAAFDKLRTEHDIAAGDIERVILGCEPLTLIHTGATGPCPTDIVGAQFSAEYGIAMRIVRGRNDVGSYLDAEAENFQDPAVASIAGRVTLETDPECAAAIPKGKVTLHMRNGAVLSATAYALGSPFNPMTRADIEKKYRDLVGRTFGDEIAESSLDLIMNLEDVENVRQITSLFART
ncbi:MmgE/PrpD family protein [Burkholderia guangdongensis]|uniref:MmgE/PrpD family protein n=1 Tax=Burkholderia guangdongensis TaxID=1792500 RepID=UPI0015CA1B5B|nr:MmgE/PrpD family protein [Burkholderia guangdongensis]